MDYHQKNKVKVNAHKAKRQMRAHARKRVTRLVAVLIEDNLTLRDGESSWHVSPHPPPSYYCMGLGRQ